MTLNVENSNYTEISQFLSEKIVAFNHAHWDIKDKQPLAISYRDANGNIEAGISGIVFGNWLTLERLWVSESLRNQGVGAKLLSAIECEAKAMSCRYVLVDTLEFQAKDFYQKYGYQLQWQQDNYPLTGTRFYLKKTL